MTHTVTVHVKNEIILENGVAQQRNDMFGLAVH